MLKCTTQLLEVPEQRKIKKESGGYGLSVKNVMDMEKNELHKAAEEWLTSKVADHALNVIEEETCITRQDFAEVIADFHLHQTKKMLEGWTDEKVKSFYTKEHFHYSVGRHYRANVDRITGAKQFRDELLKQLEQ